MNFDTIDNKLCKLIWTTIFNSPIRDSYDTIEGNSGIISRTLMYKDYSGGRSFLKDMIQNWQKLPALDGTMRLSQHLYYNSEINSNLAGKYLPIIDVDCTIDESWENILQMKKDLKLSDLLEVLDHISKDSDNVEYNRERVCKIYDRIVELGISSITIQNTIRTWAKNAQLMSKKNCFVVPYKLNYITLEGFRDHNQVYIGNPQNMDGVLNLLSLMGVKIITEDNVIPTFEGQRINTDISSRLLSTLPALAILAQDCNAQKTYNECKDTLQDKIVNTSFYQCDKIFLAYDDSGDTISKTTFAKDGKFYFTGELRPAKIEPLLQSLCSYLGINGKERELFVIMTEPDFSGIIEYLEDKEYDVTDIKAEMQPMVNSEGSTASEEDKLAVVMIKLHKLQTVMRQRLSSWLNLRKKGLM